MDALIGETELLVFVIKNSSEMMGYIAQRNLNIRIHEVLLVGWGLRWGGVRFILF
jgi:hypothetical protein